MSELKDMKELIAPTVVAPPPSQQDSTMQMQLQPNTPAFPQLMAPNHQQQMLSNHQQWQQQEQQQSKAASIDSMSAMNPPFGH